MSVDLWGTSPKNKNIDLSYNWAAWCNMLGLAREHGWKPLGTKETEFKDKKTGEITRPKDPNWNGSYCSNSFQEVTAEDAKNLAKALKKAGYPKDIIKFCERGGFLIC